MKENESLKKKIITTQWTKMSEIKDKYGPEDLASFIAVNYCGYVKKHIKNQISQVDDLTVHEIVSDVFLQFIQRNHKLTISLFNHDRKKGKFRSLLKTIVSRKVIDFFRRKKSILAEKERLDYLSSHEEEIRDRYLDFKNAFEKLKKERPSLYDAFELYYLHGYSVKETSAKLGVTENAITTRLYNSRKWLSEVLRDWKYWKDNE